jgi:hypothetical protein
MEKLGEYENRNNTSAMSSGDYIKQLKEESEMWRVKYHQAMGALGYPVPGDIPCGEIKCGLCEAKAKDITKSEVRVHTLYQVVKILAETR